MASSNEAPSSSPGHVRTYTTGKTATLSAFRGLLGVAFADGQRSVIALIGVRGSRRAHVRGAVCVDGRFEPTILPHFPDHHTTDVLHRCQQSSTASSVSQHSTIRMRKTAAYT
jgi:hypothetical protein